MQLEMVAAPARRIPLVWLGPLLALGAVWAALIALTGGDWLAMAGQWWTSSTYTHVLLVPPIIIWLVWQRVPDLAKLSAVCWWPALAGMALAVRVWAMGRLAGLAELSEAGAVLMLIAAVPLVMGPRIGAGLLFPLAYMAFLVPVGDELIPTLQVITAKLTIGLVHLTGVRATMDGVFINTPAGLFEVAEACSGVKFLMAMIAFGTLAANVCFISWRRRGWFMGSCVVVPVLANGVRAWGTVYAAQIWGAKVAGGIDHIIYGWIFFAIVITVIISASWRFFDRPVHSAMIDADAINASPRLARWERFSARPIHALVGLAVLVGAGVAWASAAADLDAPVPTHIALPNVAGWHFVPYMPRHEWFPRGGGADQRILGRYADDAGRQVDVYYALYSAQGPGRKAGGFGEGAVPEHSGWAWQAPGPAVEGAHTERLLTAGPVSRLAETTYRTDDLLTGSSLRLRLANLRDKALLRRQPTMALILSAEERPGMPAADAIAAWRAAAGPIGPWMDSMARAR